MLKYFLGNIYHKLGLALNNKNSQYFDRLTLIAITHHIFVYLRRTSYVFSCLSAVLQPINGTDFPSINPIWFNFSTQLFCRFFFLKLPRCI